VILTGRDCSRLEPSPDEDDREWLHLLAKAVRAENHLVTFDEARDDPDEVVHCERDGSWFCGRYIGTLAFEGRRLTIEPRFGIATLGHWLEIALDLRFTDTAGEVSPHEAFLPQLLARLWGNAIVRAARHGLPGLRVDVEHHGLVARGRLNVRGTIHQRERGTPGLVSVHRERSLDNAIAHAIVAAGATLTRRLGVVAMRRLLPERARDVLLALGGVNLEKRVPEPAEIAAIRYTPITASYRGLVRLSTTIARNQGLLSEASPDGTASGILVDVAEIWELYVLECLRRAHPAAKVMHGTRELDSAGHLLHNMVGERLGRLLPDAVVTAPTETFIADAKYKSLHPTMAHPAGPAREDLYQMRAYLSHWSGTRFGMLVYPKEPDGTTPAVLARAPWFFDDNRELRFVTLSHHADAAVVELRGVSQEPAHAVDAGTGAAHA
jgi:5-methylcytosine-specific restriction enzyme subunit McrC